MPGTRASAKSPKKYWNNQLDVIGLKFRWKRDVRRAIFDMIEKRGAITGIRLVREPENKYDENAIAVYLPTRVLDGRQLGYIRRSTAEILAPKLDAGSVVIVGAKLLQLLESDDWNSGPMDVTFRTIPGK